MGMINKADIVKIAEPKIIQLGGYLVDVKVSNTNVIKEAQKSIDEFGKDNADLICIGKKGISFFKNRKYNIIDDYLDFWSTLNYQHAMSGKTP